MKKNDLYPIGSVARMFHLSVGSLRHYESIGLLKPEYTDPDTGYRYYSTRQFECLNTIRYLRALDLPLDKISGFLQNRDVSKIQEMLQEQKKLVLQKQKELERIENKIDARLDQIEDALHSRLDEVFLIQAPPRRIAWIEEDVHPHSYLDLEKSIRQLDQSDSTPVVFLGKVGVGIAREKLEQNQFSTYDRVFLRLDEEDIYPGKTEILPAETCLSIRFRGGHDMAVPYYEKLCQYAKDHELAISGFSREITLIDDGMSQNPDLFVTEIQIPVLPVHEVSEN